MEQLPFLGRPLGSFGPPPPPLRPAVSHLGLGPSRLDQFFEPLRSEQLPSPVGLEIGRFSPPPLVSLPASDPLVSDAVGPSDCTRSSARLSTRTKVSVLDRAVRRKAHLLERGMGTWTTEDVKSKSALCGVILSDADAADFHNFLRAQA